MKHIIKLEVTKTICPEKLNWLRDNEADSYDEEDFRNETYELFFPTFEKMKQKLNEILSGFYQYNTTVYYDMYGNNFETSSYYNGLFKWDEEYYIEWSRLYLQDDLIDSIEAVLDSKMISNL